MSLEKYIKSQSLEIWSQNIRITHEWSRFNDSAVNDSVKNNPYSIAIEPGATEHSGFGFSLGFSA
jgi:hypothetical protein